MILFYQVGYVRQIMLIKNEKPFTVKTLSVRPPIFGKYTAVTRNLYVLQLFQERSSRKTVRDNAERYCG